MEVARPYCVKGEQIKETISHPDTKDPAPTRIGRGPEIHQTERVQPREPTKFSPRSPPRRGRRPTKNGSFERNPSPG